MRKARRCGRWVAAVAWLGLAACGGTVITQDDEDGGAAGEGGSGGAAGSGGSVTGGSGGTAGAGGSVTGGSGGGTGGGVTGGSGGGVAGSGGVPVDSCAPLPDCNWCGGKTVYDAAGCPTGYVCENGVDPCTTDPCFEQWHCGPGEYCKDMLCWPGGIVCDDEGLCSVGTGPNGASACQCEWSCNDGNTYAFDCESTPSSVSCSCMINGQEVFGCGFGGGGSGGGPAPDPCAGGDCCGFPQ